MWRSLVAHLTGGQGVAGSNPVNPTDKAPEGFSFRSFFVCRLGVCGIDGAGLGCVGLNVPEALRALAGLWRALVPL